MSSIPTDPTIILSDLHLGHRASKIHDPAQLSPILKEASTVVFNGDTAEMRTPADRLIGRRLAADLARVCHSIGCRSVFLNGNHDPVISKIDHLDLMDGRALVTHGDILFLGVAPWSKKALAYRKIHLRALAQLGPDALMNFEKRLLATKRTSIKLQLMEHAVSRSGSIPPGIRLLMQQLWPPHRILMILQAWLETPALAGQLTELFRPAARYILIGHTHYPGHWRHRQVNIVNTGSFVLHFGALAAILNGASLELRKVQEKKGNFILGKTVARFHEAQAVAPELA
jgi:predicted phosphodiesterase